MCIIRFNATKSFHNSIPTTSKKAFYGYQALLMNHCGFQKPQMKHQKSNYKLQTSSSCFLLKCCLPGNKYKKISLCPTVWFLMFQSWRMIWTLLTSSGHCLPERKQWLAHMNESIKCLNNKWFDFFIRVSLLWLV